jgi:hypothetical protein
MTPEEIKKLEQLWLQFEAGLSFQDLKVAQRIDALIEEFHRFQRDNERLSRVIEAMQSEEVEFTPDGNVYQS